MNKFILIVLVAIALAGEKCATNEELINSDFGEYKLKYKFESEDWKKAQFIGFEMNDEYCSNISYMLWKTSRYCALKTNKETTFKIKGVDDDNTFQIFSEDKSMKFYYSNGVYMYDIQSTKPVNDESKMHLIDATFEMVNYKGSLGVEATAVFMPPEVRKTDRYTAIVNKNTANFCFEKVKRNTDSVPNASDLRIDNIDAYAFSGGGFRALVYQWSVFHALAKWENKTLQDMLGGKSVGSISGGSWFMNRMLYGPNVVKSFKKEESEKIGSYVEDMITNTLNVLIQRVEMHPNSEGALSRAMGVLCSLFKSTTEKKANYYLEGMCREETKKVIKSYAQEKNGWKKFVEEIHENFEKTSLHNINWTTIAALNLKFKYKPENGNHYISELLSEDDDYRQYPGFPVLSKILIPANENKDNEMEIKVDIPKFEGTTELYIEKDGNTTGKINTTPEDVYELIKNEIADPKFHSGPSSNFPGLFTSENFNSKAHMVSDAIAREAEKFAYNLIWTTKEFESTKDGEKSPFGLADGGMHDNTGITAAVKNLQERRKGDVTTKRIVAIQPEEVDANLYELKNLFEDTTDMPHFKRAKPFPTIFEGSFNGSKVNPLTMRANASGHINAFVIDVKSVENKDWGIKEGYSYKLIYIVPKCENDISLLPQAGTQQKYGTCATETAKRVEELQQNLLDRENEELEENRCKVALGKWRKQLEQKKKPVSSSNAYGTLGNSWIQFVVIYSAALFF